jgi:hypothetical protein
MNLQKATFSLLLLLLSGSIYAQEGPKRVSSSEWNTLAKVSYKTATDQYGEVSIPIFGAEVKALEGKQIALQGYMIPLDGIEGMFKPNHFILSSLPVEACFFCGTGGPETVVEVHMKAPVKYTKEVIRLKGRLTLNGLDPYQMMYIMEDAEQVASN